MNEASEANAIRRFPRFGASPTRSKLIELLSTGKIGDVLTDEQLEKCCGFPTAPGGKGYGALRSACRFVWRHEPHLVWHREIGAGAIRCLDPQGIVITADGSTKRIRRESGKAVERLSTIQLESVKMEERPAVLSRMAMLGTIAQFANGGSVKKLEARNISKPLSAAELLQGFR